MKTNHQNNDQLAEEDVLAIKRMRVRSSAKLKKNILKLTEELPQYTDQTVGAEVYNIAPFFEKVSIKRFNFGSIFKPYAATIAAGVAAIVITSSFWSPVQEDQLVFGSIETLSVERLANEIEWQDLMLLQDELAFAGL